MGGAGPNQFRIPAGVAIVACNDVMSLRSRRNKSRKRSVTHGVTQPVFSQVHIASTVYADGGQCMQMSPFAADFRARVQSMNASLAL